MCSALPACDVPEPACSMDDERAGLEGVTGSKRATKGEQRMLDALSAQVAQTVESACRARDPICSLGWEDPLEEGMATHASTLAWRIPRTEELGGLQSMGSQRAGHD